MSTSGIDRWLDRLKKAEKTSLIQDGKRKIHYTFDDKTEMAEDYNIQSGELLVRKWKRKSTLGGSLPWEYEVGQGVENIDGGRAAMMDKLDFQESSSNPIFVRLDTLSSFQWRIRNLTWPSDNYIVDLDESETSIVIKTKNKKYYKNFNIPDLERIGMRRLEKRNLNYTHSNNTLIINYLKPDEILHMEKLIKNELSKMKSNKDGDVECKPS